jgi:hypothetical protein
MMRTTTILIVQLFIFYSSLFGQLFTKITMGDIVHDSTISQASCWGDYNNDGYLDLFVGNGSASSSFLYRNNNNGTFTKITNGVVLGASCTSGTWGDYDNDGYLDLFVPTYGGLNLLYKNNGDGTFTRITQGDIVNESMASTTGSWADYDNDGDLDLFVGNYLGENNALYRNEGNGMFTKITEGDIVDDGGGSFGCAWGDYDDDGYMDLFVANWNIENNFLYRNNADGTFTKITNSVVVNDGGNSSAGSWGDYDNDGDIDLFVTNYGPNENNFLYRNAGNGTFLKVNSGVIVNDIGKAQGSCWGDFNNDGYIDLFVTNGGYQNSEVNILYQNLGSGTFIKITGEIVVNEVSESYGCSWGDYDNDGYIDLFVTNGGYGNIQNNFLYKNNGNTNNWINIFLSGTLSNKFGIGAKVRLKANGIWQMREISTQTGLGSQNSINAEFGLGSAQIIDSIQVEWPSGTIQILENVSINNYLTIFEENANSITHYKTIPTKFTIFPNYPNPFNPTTTISYYTYPNLPR